jgi:hypothetical protein
VTSQPVRALILTTMAFILSALVRLPATAQSPDFDGDGFDDLAISVPWEDHSGFNAPGAVHVIYGATDGLSSAGSQLWHQNSPGMAETEDQLGGAIAGR